MDIQRYESVVQTQKNPHTTSGKYSFIPRTKALEVFADCGWFPTKVIQANVRKLENRGYQRHLIRLTNDSLTKELAVGDTTPQIALVNSHGGASSFQLYIALLEKVCSNGLIVERGQVGVCRIPHLGYTADKVAVATRHIVGLFPQVLTERERYQAIRLDPAQQDAFARAAIELRFDGAKWDVESADLLRSYRQAQREPTLWNTFNVVQENVLRGRIPHWNRATGQLSRSRAVNSIAENVRLNQALWRLTEETAKSAA